MPGAWKCWLNICYLHHYPSWCMYLDYSWLCNWPKWKKTPVLLLVFSLFLSSSPIRKVVLFSEVPTKCHPHSIWILHHYCVLNDHLSQSLAPGGRRNLTREKSWWYARIVITGKKLAAIRVTRKARLENRWQWHDSTKEQERRRGWN